MRGLRAYRHGISCVPNTGLTLAGLPGSALLQITEYRPVDYVVEIVPIRAIGKKRPERSASGLPKEVKRRLHDA
jgi:hypothetical protein